MLHAIRRQVPTDSKTLDSLSRQERAVRISLADRAAAVVPAVAELRGIQHEKRKRSEHGGKFQPKCRNGGADSASHGDAVSPVHCGSKWASAVADRSERRGAGHGDISLVGPPARRGPTITSVMTAPALAITAIAGNLRRPHSAGAVLGTDNARETRAPPRSSA
jgi:hypothetical protein